MKIALVSSIVPFIDGGARFIVLWLEEKLKEHGHQVERFHIPFVDNPNEVLGQTAAFRLLRLTDTCERVITFRPPAHVIDHPEKILWFIHHIRVFYDLWGRPNGLPATESNRAIRQAVMAADTKTILEARKIYTNSNVVADRLKRFNGVVAETLYPPILNPERFRNDGYGDEIVVVCRLEPHKRQWELVEAMKHVRTDVRLRLCGAASDPAYGRAMQSLIVDAGLQERVVFEDRWISESEKVDRLARALAVAYVPYDEDSYGYPSLEAAHAEKAVLTTVDSGGVLELVQDGLNGLVVQPEPAALAEAMDRLYRDRQKTVEMGKANSRRQVELNIDWDHVVRALTS